MNNRVSKPRTRRSRVKLSEDSQRKLQDAVASTGAGTHADNPLFTGEHVDELGVESPSRRGDLGQGTAPASSTKRQLDATTENDLVPIKRARLTQTHAHHPGLEETESEQAAETILQQPKPTPPQRPYPSFLKDFVDPPHPNHLSSIHTSVSEWLESVGLNKEKRCRSDSHLRRSKDDPISRQTTRSAPGMSYTREADGFIMPRTPASTGSWSYQADTDARSVAPSDLTGVTPSSGRSYTKSLVEDPLYRDMNLAANDIYMRSPHEEFPEPIAELVNYVRRDRDSPGPSLDEVRQNGDLSDLKWQGAGESQVEQFFGANIFPYPKHGNTLQRTDRQPMAKHTVPSTGSKLKVSMPVPDMLYGYKHHMAFPQQQSQLISMGAQMVANNQRLIYPFFAIEFKADGPSGAGSLWVATNQCLGASTSCVNIAERLNVQLRKCTSSNIQPVSSAAFSIAMSGTEARLHVSWKHNELEYYMAEVESFLLQKPADYIEFRKYVRNILDWGNDRRLNDIRDSLESLLEESRKVASLEAKSRQPPSDVSATTKAKKPKSSSSRSCKTTDSV